MLIVGLTGGVASGKSTVSKVLREEGAYIIDADQIARELVQPHTPTWQELIETFGEEILTEGWIHPPEEIGCPCLLQSRKERSFKSTAPSPDQRRNRTASERDRSERPRGHCSDRCSPPCRDRRLSRDGSADRGPFHRGPTDRAVGKKGWNEAEEEARRIVSAQMPLEEKVKVADIVIRNEGSIEETRRKAKEVFQELRGLALQKGKGAYTRQGSAHSQKGGEKRGL